MEIRAAPKLEIARTERLNLRLTKFEREKISRVAKQKNLTKTDGLRTGVHKRLSKVWTNIISTKSKYSQSEQKQRNDVPICRNVLQTIL